MATLQEPFHAIRVLLAVAVIGVGFMSVTSAAPVVQAAPVQGGVQVWVPLNITVIAGGSSTNATAVTVIAQTTIGILAYSNMNIGFGNGSVSVTASGSLCAVGAWAAGLRIWTSVEGGGKLFVSAFNGTGCTSNVTVLVTITALSTQPAAPASAARPPNPAVNGGGMSSSGSRMLYLNTGIVQMGGFVFVSLVVLVLVVVRHKHARRRQQQMETRRPATYVLALREGR
jgi:hypothetical protein